MLRNLVLQIISGVLGLWLASQFIPGVEFDGPLFILGLAGLVLGAVNFFIRPILKFITMPLRMLTFGLFGLIINAVLIWLIDLFFPELTIGLGMPLIWTTLLLWGLSALLHLFFPKKKNV